MGGILPATGASGILGALVGGSGMLLLLSMVGLTGAMLARSLPEV